jgi:hypothetical protein
MRPMLASIAAHRVKILFIFSVELSTSSLVNISCINRITHTF